MKINLIFATDLNLLFGANNSIPWHNSHDLAHFNRITSCNHYLNKNIVVMGSKTWESLGKPLANRTNVVISKNNVQNCDFKYDSFDDFIKIHMNFINDNIKVFVIGGKMLLEDVITNYLFMIDSIYYSVIKDIFYVDEKTTIYLKEEMFQSIEKYKVKYIQTDSVDYYLYKINHDEHQYLDLLRECFDSGDFRDSRNAKTLSLFSKKMSFDLKDGFPLLTTKQMFMRGIFEELMLFLRGQTNSKILEEKKVNIWKPNTTNEFISQMRLPYNEGDMGPMYGYQWRHFGCPYEGCDKDYSDKGYDQIEDVLGLLLNDPHSRRIIMTTFNPLQAKEGVLYPCHSIVVQFYVNKVDEKFMLSMNMYQRSGDLFLGVPFNIASNGLLMHLVCKTLNDRIGKQLYYPNQLHIILGDVHVYDSHIEAVKTQMNRCPYKFPMINVLKGCSNIEDYKWEDIVITEYKCHPAIKADMVA